MQKVYHGDTVKTYSIRICDDSLETYFHDKNGVWLHEENLPDDYLDDEDFHHISADIQTIVDDILDIIPGMEELDFYGDHILGINLRELKDGGWSEEKLCSFLEKVSEYVHNKLPFESEYIPDTVQRTDAYGSQYTVMEYGKFEIPEEIKDLI